MLTYEKLSRKPHAFRSMTGLNIDAFDQIFVEFECYHPETEAERLARPDRQRAPGAGGQFKHDLRTRLLMTFVWLRVYPILEVLGVLFELDKSNVSRNVKFIMFDLGLIGLQNDRGDVEIILPLRKPKDREPSAEQTAYNRLVSRCRVMVENAIEIGYGQTNSYR